MLKIVIKENQLLNEITIADVMTTLKSKAVKKTVYQYELLYDQEQGFNRDKEANWPTIEEEIQESINQIEAIVYAGIPNDLNDNQKGLCAAWLKKFLLSSFDIFKKYRYMSVGKNNIGFVRHNLESYFKVHRFVRPEERDLMKIADSVDLNIAVEAAMPAYKEYLAKKEYGDATKGTELIYEDAKWQIFIPHNKGAACQLGKGTSWCTAAPGLEYYQEYHKADDPLFVVFQKPPTQEAQETFEKNPELQKYGAWAKFQFHYGTKQFMDAQDEPITRTQGGNQILKEVHNILAKTVGDRYSFLNDIVQTKWGLSVPEIQQVAPHLPMENILYKDLATGVYSNSEDKPSINISEYEEGDMINITWQTPFYGRNEYEEEELDSELSRDSGPAQILVEYRADKKRFILRKLVWGKDGHRIARLEPDIPNSQPKVYSDDNLTDNLQNKEIWFENFYKQYLTEIKPKLSDWTLEQLKKYLPSDMQYYYANGFAAPILNLLNREISS